MKIYTYVACFASAATVRISYMNAVGDCIHHAILCAKWNAERARGRRTANPLPKRPMPYW